MNVCSCLVPAPHPLYTHLCERCQCSIVTVERIAPTAAPVDAPGEATPFSASPGDPNTDIYADVFTDTEHDRIVAILRRGGWSS